MLSWYNILSTLVAIQAGNNVLFSNAFCLRHVTQRVTLSSNINVSKAGGIGAETSVHPMPNEESFLLATHGRTGSAGKDLVVIKFHAPWCRACRGLEPKYKRLAMEYSPKRVVFYEMSHKEITGVIRVPDS
jgi:thiol-disulfide isomerase/thioredoxin